MGGHREDYWQMGGITNENGDETAMATGMIGWGLGVGAVFLSRWEMQICSHENTGPFYQKLK